MSAQRQLFRAWSQNILRRPYTSSIAFIEGDSIERQMGLSGSTPSGGLGSLAASSGLGLADAAAGAAGTEDPCVAILAEALKNAPTGDTNVDSRSGKSQNPDAVNIASLQTEIDQLKARIGDENSGLTKELKDANAAKKQLKQRIEGDGTNPGLLKEKEKLEKKIGSESDADSLEGQLKTAKDELATANSNLTTANDNLATRTTERDEALSARKCEISTPDEALAQPSYRVKFVERPEDDENYRAYRALQSGVTAEADRAEGYFKKYDCLRVQKKDSSGAALAPPTVSWGRCGVTDDGVYADLVWQPVYLTGEYMLKLKGSTDSNNATGLCLTPGAKDETPTLAACPANADVTSCYHGSILRNVTDGTTNTASTEAQVSLGSKKADYSRVIKKMKYQAASNTAAADVLCLTKGASNTVVFQECQAGQMNQKIFFDSSELILSGPGPRDVAGVLGGERQAILTYAVGGALIAMPFVVYGLGKFYFTYGAVKGTSKSSWIPFSAQYTHVGEGFLTTQARSRAPLAFQTGYWGSLRKGEKAKIDEGFKADTITVKVQEGAQPLQDKKAILMTWMDGTKKQQRLIAIDDFGNNTINVDETNRALPDRESHLDAAWDRKTIDARDLSEAYKGTAHNAEFTIDNKSPQQLQQFSEWKKNVKNLEDPAFKALMKNTTMEKFEGLRNQLERADGGRSPGGLLGDFDMRELGGVSQGSFRGRNNRRKKTALYFCDGPGWEA